MHRIRLDVLLLLLTLVAAAPLLVACGELPRAAKAGAAGETGHGAKASAKKQDADADADEEDAEEKDDQREELEDAVADLAKARLDLEIAQFETMHGDRRDRVASDEARLDKEEAQQHLDVFLASEKPERLARLTLSLEQGTDRVYQAEQELKELEAMYAAEDFASMTKELVLHRGRKQIEFARRDLALDQSAAERTRDVEVPMEEATKRRALQKAADAVIVLNEDYEKNRLDRIMRISDATRAVNDLRRKIKRLDGKLGTRTESGPPAGGGLQPGGPEDMPDMGTMPPPGPMPPPPGAMPPPGLPGGPGAGPR